MAGSPTCTIRASSAGSAASTCRRWCCGENRDGVVKPAYGRAYAALIPGARFAADRRGRASSRVRAAGGARRSRSRVPRPLTDNSSERRAMDAWWMCEMPYPHVPQEVLDAADSVRASLPNRYCDPRVAADLFEEVIDEYLLCDEIGLNVCAIEHHAGINSLVGSNPMLVSILARQTRKVRILSLGHAGLAAPRAGAHRRGVRHRRRHLARPARDRLRQIGRHRDGVGQRQPGQQHRALLGGDRPDRQGAHPPDGPFSLGGQALHPSPRQHLAAPLAATASAHVGGDRRSAHRRRGRPPRHGAHAGAARARRHAARLCRLSRRARARPGCRRRRPTTSPTRAFVYVGDTDEEGSGSAASCCGSSTPA